MASLRVHSDRLEIQLTPAEKVLALRREDLSVQRSAIRSIKITDDPWIWIRGIRAPGTLVPLVLAVGTWKFHGGKDFLVVKSKRQAVIIDVDDEEYTRLILSTNHAADLVDTLNIDAPPARKGRKPRRTAKSAKAADAASADSSAETPSAE